MHRPKRRSNQKGYITYLGQNRAKPYAAYTPKIYVNGVKKRVFLGSFVTYDEADEALCEWLKKKSSKINYTWSMLYDDWKIKGYKNLAKSTIDGYNAAWKKMERLYDLKVTDICKGDFQSLIDDLNEQGLSYSSINNVRVLASMLEQHAIDYRIITVNSAHKLDMPDEPDEEREIFTDEQINKIEKAAAEGDRTAKIITVMMYGGWRIGELLDLKPEDYNPELDCFVGGNKTESGKGRTVPVHPAVKMYIQEFLQEGGPYVISRPQLVGRGVDKHYEYVRLTPNYFRRYMFSDFLERLGIFQSDGEPFTPHVTRHVFCSWCKKYEVDPHLVKRLAGHKIPKSDVTEKKYTHIDYDMLMSAILQIKANRNKQQ